MVFKAMHLDRLTKRQSVNRINKRYENKHYNILVFRDLRGKTVPVKGIEKAQNVWSPRKKMIKYFKEEQLINSI